MSDPLNPPVLSEEKFIIPVVPRTMQFGHKVNFKTKHFYTDPKKLKYFDEIRSEITHQIKKIYTGMISVGFDFYLPRPENRTQSTDGMIHASPAVGKGVPDLANLIKGTEDALNGVLWTDDCQTYRYLDPKRMFCEQALWPRIEIIVQDHGPMPTAETIKITKPRKKKSK